MTTALLTLVVILAALPVINVWMVGPIWAALAVTAIWLGIAAMVVLNAIDTRKHVALRDD